MAVKTWVWVVLGVVGLFMAGFLALFGVGIYMFTQHVDWESATPASAEERFEQARMQFEGEIPLITITGGTGLEISRREEQSHAKAEALHVLTWDPDDERVVSLSIPFWLLRLMGRGTIDLSEDDDNPFDDFDLTFEDLEWHGPRSHSRLRAGGRGGRQPRARVDPVRVIQGSSKPLLRQDEPSSPLPAGY